MLPEKKKKTVKKRERESTKKSRSLRSEEGSPEEGTEDGASNKALQVSGFANDDRLGSSTIDSVFSGHVTIVMAIISDGLDGLRYLGDRRWRKENFFY